MRDDETSVHSCPLAFGLEILGGWADAGIGIGRHERGHALLASRPGRAGDRCGARPGSCHGDVPRPCRSTRAGQRARAGATRADRRQPARARSRCGAARLRRCRRGGDRCGLCSHHPRARPARYPREQCRLAQSPRDRRPHARGHAADARDEPHRRLRPRQGRGRADAAAPLWPAHHGHLGRRPAVALGRCCLHRVEGRPRRAHALVGGGVRAARHHQQRYRARLLCHRDQRLSRGRCGDAGVSRAPRAAAALGQSRGNRRRRRVPRLRRGGLCQWPCADGRWRLFRVLLSGYREPVRSARLRDIFAGQNRKRPATGRRYARLDDGPPAADRVLDPICGGVSRRYRDRDADGRGADPSLQLCCGGAARPAAGQGARRLGVGPGDRVATIAWNSHRHFELYFAISGIGAVCHTINPRLFADQLSYIVNHAEDKVMFLDLTFVPIAEKMAALWGPVEHYVIMTDRAHMPQTGLPGALCYEDLVAGETPDLAWPDFDENTASSLCYTSGTTGNPKGALYTHRSTLLHSFAICSANAVGISMRDSILPVVPMFHVNAWGVPYAAAMSGAKLVFPGPKLDGASLHELFEAEKVTLSLGVPTVWLGLLQYLEQTGKRLDGVDRVTVGGSAVPAAMIQAFEEKYGVQCIHGWGMTEMSPVGTLALPKAKFLGRSKAEQLARKAMQGFPLYGVDMQVVAPDGKVQPHDGASSGELYVRGPWIVSGYFNDAPASAAAFDEEGWFRTGDVCTIDAEGYMQIVDRSKDVIKSGGEWISSIDVENAAMGHPDIAEAAVIGVAHPKWDERPLLIVVAKPGKQPSKEEILALLGDKIAKWQLPDDVVFVAEIPHGATGKVLKARLREQFKDYRLPTV